MVAFLRLQAGLTAEEQGDDPGKGGSSDDLAPVGGPYQSPAHLSVPHTVSVIEQNRDSIVGIKIALSKSTAAAYPGGPAAGEALFYEGALEVSAVESFRRPLFYCISFVFLHTKYSRGRLNDSTAYG